ncbi:MAG: AMP-binding protein [Prevotella sp.]|nr:AMP-binding protein [Prevotella sp.]
MDLDAFLKEWHDGSPTLTVHTSGSTGQPKPMLVEKRRMEASARITCRFLGLKAGDTALLCLPLDYIAGKMMVVRALTCGLRLISVAPSGHPLKAPPTAPEGASIVSAHEKGVTSPPLGGVRGVAIDFAAMVPLQVWNSLQVPEERERLMQIRHLIIGGGAIDEELEQQLKTFPNAVWSTYGMTETLSHIALRRLNGPDASPWYTPFEGVSVSLNADGCLVIDAPAVHEGPLVTNDIAEIKTLPAGNGEITASVDKQGVQSDCPPPCREGLGVGLFRILGRKDNVICSGGVKIQAEEVERLLRPHLKAPFCITHCKDPRLGEAVVLLTEERDAERLRPVCEQVLTRLWKPRHYISIDKIPLTATGKIARKEAYLSVCRGGS